MLVPLGEHSTLIVRIRRMLIAIPASKIYFSTIGPQNTKSFITHHHAIDILFNGYNLRVDINKLKNLKHHVMQLLRGCTLRGWMEKYLWNHKGCMQNLA